MINQLIYKITRRRHPWRVFTFDELSEIYTSMSLRSLGFGIIGIFVPIFLFSKEVSLTGIFWFFLWVFLLRIPLSFSMAFIVGRIGPKHGIALSTLLFLVFLGMLLTFESVGWPLIALASAFTISNGLFFLSYHTDFSKVKNTKHGGKELGWLYTFERVGGALGPLIGGLTASLIAPEASIVLAIIVLGLSLVPLFLTNEPVKLHQKISFFGFPWRRHTRDFIAMSGAHLDTSSSQFVWPLFVSVVVFGGSAYAKVGAIIAAATAVSLVSTRLFGVIVDSKKGGVLLSVGVWANSILHLFRPFVLTGASATLVSTMNEPITLSYRMPLMKGYYDAADSEEGYRIVYLALMEFCGAIVKSLYFLGLWICAEFWFSDVSVLRWNFVVIGFLSLFILAQKFPALRKA